MRLMQGGKEVTVIDFGSVEFGTKKEISVDLVNDSEAALRELQVSVNPEITIESKVPAFMLPQDTITLQLSWMPKLEIKKPINVNLEITGKEVFE
jgi:hypothetical protein